MNAIENWPVSRLIEYARNPRNHEVNNAVERIAAAIQEFGFRVPILAKSDGLVVDGHLRLKAARTLGLETVPVILCDDMTDNQVRAFRLSVNKMADLAEWDNDLLSQELPDIDIDLSILGFSDEELSALLTHGVDEDTEYLDDATVSKDDNAVIEPEPEAQGGVSVPLLIDNCPRVLYKQFLEIKKQVSAKKNVEVLKILVDLFIENNNV